jgi:tetratricopeptide (TPR) repeat protein
MRLLAPICGGLSAELAHEDKLRNIPCYSDAMSPRNFASTPLAVGLCSAVIAGLLVGCATSPSSTQTSGAPPAAPSARESEALPNDPNALVLGAEVALKRGQYREAAQAYLRAAQLGSDEALCEQATRVAFEHEQWTLVLASAQRWLELNQTSEQAHRFAAFAALHLYRIDAAVEHLAFLVESAFINPRAGFLALLPQMSAEGSPPATMAAMQRLVEKHPELTEAHYALGRAALQSDHLELALKSAQRARELGRFWSPAGLLLAQVQLARGEVDAGLATAKEVLSQDNQDTLRLEYALMLLQAGKDEEAKKELDTLSNASRTAAIVERAMADIDFALGNREAAKQRYNNLVANGAFVYESWFYLGAIAEARDAKDDALQFYGRVTGSDLAVPAQARAARIKIERGELKDGLQHLEQFAASNPQYTLGLITARANLLAENKQGAAALRVLDEAIARYPDSSELRFARVFQMEKLDRVDAAVAQMRQLVAERPGDPTATNALGYTLVDRTRQRQEGLKLIEQALSVTPDSGAVLDSMGWALHRLKRNEEALVYMQRAKSRINDVEVELHLAEVLLALGRKDDALATLTEAAKRFPENDRVEQRLKSVKR